MTPEQINIAIAEACGWQGFEGAGEFLIGAQPHNEVTERYCGKRVVTNWTPRFPVPNYYADLNAMHAAWSDLAGSQKTRSTLKLREIVLRDGCGPFYVDRINPNWQYESWMFEAYLVNATTAQRAEAFLRTLNLWKTQP